MQNSVFTLVARIIGNALSKALITLPRLGPQGIGRTLGTPSEMRRLIGYDSRAFTRRLQKK